MTTAPQEMSTAATKQGAVEQGRLQAARGAADEDEDADDIDEIEQDCGGGFDLAQHVADMRYEEAFGEHAEKQEVQRHLIEYVAKSMRSHPA